MNSNIHTQRAKTNPSAWKASLAREIVDLEDNLAQIYYTAGLKPHRLVDGADTNGDAAIADNGKGIRQHELRDYQAIVDEQVREVDQAASNICDLISSVTEFELPIPVSVLLKLATRVGAIRCPDFRKKVPGTLAKKYIYTDKSLQLIGTSLSLYERTSAVLSTNILPFQPSINQNLINLLAWTRTSGLFEHNQRQYYELRVRIIANISWMLERLSLNLNLDNNQLTALVGLELVESVAQLLTDKSSTEADASAVPGFVTSLGGRNQLAQNNEEPDNLACAVDAYVIEVLSCLDKLFVVYADFLDAKLELKLKSFVIQTCMKIYRHFDRKLIGLACRRQLLRLLESIANRPFAASTTEIAWHIFELAEKMESDPEMRYLARRCIKFGLAHRPIVVSHFDVHDCYANRCSVGETNESSEIGMSDDNQQVSTGDKAEILENGRAGAIESDKVATVEDRQVDSDDKVENIEDGQVETDGKVAGIEDKQVGESDKVESGDDEQVKPYLDLFVDSLVDSIAP